jgi:hypothetical protein
MIDYITPIESAIVSQLSANILDARIDNDPQDTRAIPKCRILVYFSGETGNQASQNNATQRVDLDFSVDVQLADQRINSHKNIYPYLAAVKDTLIGFSPNGSAPLRFTSNQYQEMPDGSGVRWRYLMQFGTTTMWRASGWA